MPARELYPSADEKTTAYSQGTSCLGSHSTASTQDHMAAEPGACCSGWGRPVGTCLGPGPLGLTSRVRCSTGRWSQGESEEGGEAGGRCPL